MEIIPYNKNLKFRSRDLRNKSTVSEVILWNNLKRKQLGFQFLRQKPINNYIVDFYCKELKLAIELDGSSHDNKREDDSFRQGQLESFGITFLRFSNNRVLNNIEGVLAEIKIKAKLIKTSPAFQAPPSKGDFPSADQVT